MQAARDKNPYLDSGSRDQHRIVDNYTDQLIHRMLANYAAMRDQYRNTRF